MKMWLIIALFNFTKYSFIDLMYRKSRIHYHIYYQWELKVNSNFQFSNLIFSNSFYRNERFYFLRIKTVEFVSSICFPRNAKSASQQISKLYFIVWFGKMFTLYEKTFFNRECNDVRHSMFLNVFFSKKKCLEIVIQYNLIFN